MNDQKIHKRQEFLQMALRGLDVTRAEIEDELASYTELYRVRQAKPGVRRPRRRLTADGRRRISEAVRRRWALRRKTAQKGNK